MLRPGPSLRVATYNVHGCIGTDRRHDPERVASVVGELDADIVALQEFTYAASVAIETRQPVELVALDGYECALGPTRQSATRCFGNALLTRHPIVEIQRLDLSIDGREPRGALAATVDVGGTHVHLLATHLGLRVRERRFQVQQMLSYLESVQHSLIVVLGDINDWLPLRSVVHVLDRRLGAAPRLRSFPSSRPLLSLDRIWIHPAAALTGMFVHRSALARRASDHLPVVADIDLGQAPSHLFETRDRARTSRAPATPFHRVAQPLRAAMPQQRHGCGSSLAANTGLSPDRPTWRSSHQRKANR
jgi:endonuclease/exonuclease/phosphatase family metal-dependent hydrolase